MKLQVTFILIIFFTFGVLNAQDSTFKEIGLNATPFVNQYLDFGSGNGEFSSPYMITYEQRFGRLGSRVGVGLVGNNNMDKPVNGVPTEPVFHQNDLSFDARWGVLMYKEISKKWNLKYGLDAIVSIDNNKNWTEVKNVFGDLVTNTNSQVIYETGLSPFVFVQFQISDHFSIGTELVGRAARFENITKVQSSEFPQFDSRQESTGTSFSIAPPTALYFIFRI